MDDKVFSLINLDGASDVIIKMLEMIEKSVGWIVTPKGSRKDFDDGLTIYKESIEKDNSLCGLEKGAKISNAKRELKQYINQGKIISNASKYLRDDAKFNIEDDWLLSFFEYAKNISDDTIQEIWGKILAEQFNGDSSVSRKLLHTLSLLDKDTALDFGKLSSITFGLSNATLNEEIIIKYIPFIYYKKVELYEDVGKYDIEYHKYFPDDLSRLEEYGLITVSSDKPYEEYLLNFAKYFMFIGDRKYLICKNTDSNAEDFEEKIMISNVRYTLVGEELYKIINKPPLYYGLSQHIKCYLKKQGVKIESVI